MQIKKQEKAKEIEKFERRISGRKRDTKTVDIYVRWAGLFLDWLEDHGGFDSVDSLLYDFDEYLSEAKDLSYNTRLKALSGVKLFLRINFDRRVDEDVQEFLSGEEYEFSPEWYDEDEVKEIFDEVGDCSYLHCYEMNRLAYHCIMRPAEVCKIRVSDIDRDDQTIEVRAVKHSIPRAISISDEVFNLIEPILDKRDRKDPLFLTYETEDREGFKFWESNSWSAHCTREHDFKPHKLYRHSSIINKLKKGWDFGDVYLRSRHVHPSMTSKYCEFAGVETPEWVEESPF